MRPRVTRAQMTPIILSVVCLAVFLVGVEVVQSLEKRRQREEIRAPVGDEDPAGRWHRRKDGLIEAYEVPGSAEWAADEKYDPLEDVPEFRRIFEYVDRLVLQRATEKIGPREKWPEGTCYGLWAEKKRILRVQFRIDWKSPEEMNPGILYD